ncbi:putative conjugative transposon mobilization protein [Acetoanaerobium sticklandii]|uniref:Putative conjugative transposon mobilization protein n=1 Tax=Acetoanaerobium sticklandii (strain ATCC 12662 / DSM 519 / JCM 1433 / CCUG 9281 / NCIMB 10654 / HF) TaxID=499177 RepID=E3PUV6_ACESD|nr:relaxase/mobilization nuclease domain-containing protein [Acetoanaerobium sticklandii]CBH20436.1 putative conjugative transposon mobilization protein [Acetoanaerobium sticklandii]
MAITKIHPIKSNLKKSIDYICNSEKTLEEIYVKTNLCSRENAHKEFEITKKQFHSKTKTLAHHLIQSFLPGEVSYEEAHKVGKELCESIFGQDYEYILATHVDKNNIHNHVIFNSVDVNQGKVYQSYYGSYMKIRNKSDRICKEHNLSIITPEIQKDIDYLKTRTFTNWFDWKQDKLGKSAKSSLKEALSSAIDLADNWREFLDLMIKYDYEIKQGKHIAFKHKSQDRFIRAKTLGEAFTEDNIRQAIRTNFAKRKDEKLTSGFIEWLNNEKARIEKIEATKANIASRIGKIVKVVKNYRIRFQNLCREEVAIKKVTPYIETCVNKRAHYEGHIKNPNDKIYNLINKKDIQAYQNSFIKVEEFLKRYPKYKELVLKGIKDKTVFQKLKQQYSSIDKEKGIIYKEIIKLENEFDILVLERERIEKLEQKNIPKENNKEETYEEKVERALAKKREMAVDKPKKKKSRDMEL